MSGYWTNFCLDRPHDHDACRSWFGGMLREDDKLLLAQGFENDNGDMPRLRVLYQRPDGSLRQALRANNKRTFRITCARPSADVLKIAKDRGVLPVLARGEDRGTGG